MKNLTLFLILALGLVHCGGREYTIANQTTGEEDVYIYLKEEGKSDLKKQVLPPSGCFLLREREFEQIIIKATRGGMGVGEKVLCGEGDSCAPANYEVVNNSDAAFVFDNYVLLHVEQQQDDESCSLLLN